MPKIKVKCEGYHEKCEGTFYHYTTVRHNKPKRFCPRCLREKAKDGWKRYTKRKMQIV